MNRVDKLAGGIPTDVLAHITSFDPCEPGSDLNKHMYTQNKKKVIDNLVRLATKKHFELTEEQPRNNLLFMDILRMSINEPLVISSDKMKKVFDILFTKGHMCHMISKIPEMTFYDDTYL